MNAAELLEQVRASSGLTQVAGWRRNHDGRDAKTAGHQAAMVSNLLVVLVGDREARPVVSTGSHYQ
jgi:hypothetical protein